MDIPSDAQSGLGDGTDEVEGFMKVDCPFLPFVQIDLSKWERKAKTSEKGEAAAKIPLQIGGKKRADAPEFVLHVHDGFCVLLEEVIEEVFMPHNGIPNAELWC